MLPMRNKDIVIIGLQPWYTDIGSNCKNLAIEFSKTHRVLYVNIPLNRISLIKERNEAYVKAYRQVKWTKKEALTLVHKNLWIYTPRIVHESINWIPSTGLFSYLNYQNNKRLAKDIREGVKELGFEKFIIFNDNDIFRGYWLKELLDPVLYVYYCRDFLTSFGYFKKHGAKIEPLHIRKADLAVANSIYLTDYLKKYNQNSYCIGQGCNLSLFDARISRPRPIELQNISKPIIGYVGYLTTARLDVSLMILIAKKKPEWELVLVGPEDDEFKRSELHQLENVKFLGKKDVGQLPDYIQSCDVCINPQLINDLTIGNYPLKVDEYLAMGKPVVAINTSGMALFKEYCYLANSHEQYLMLIEKALHEDRVEFSEKRIAIARQHSWENSAEKFHRCLEETTIKLSLNREE